MRNIIPVFIFMGMLLLHTVTFADQEKADAKANRMLFAAEDPTLLSQKEMPTKDADAIIKMMRSELESHTSSYQMTFLTKQNGKIVGRMTAGVAKKNIGKERCALLVLLSPESVAGIAYLFRVSEDQSVDQWNYIPVIGRVRKISGMTVRESFLGTDLTYADVSFPFRDGEHKFLGEEEKNGILTYKIETVPKKNEFLYSRIVTWVDESTNIPIVQEYYDSSKQIWKRQHRENIVVIDKVPVVISSKMYDLQRNTSTETHVNEILTDTTSLTDDVFVPEQLKHSLKCPVWEKVCYIENKHNK